MSAVGSVAGLAAVGAIRQYEMAAGIELVTDRRLGDVIVALPPVTTTDSETGQIATALRTAIPEACA